MMNTHVDRRRQLSGGTLLVSCLLSSTILIVVAAMMMEGAVAHRMMQEEEEARRRDGEWGAPPHHCIHDTPGIQRLLYNGMDQAVPQAMKDRRFDPQAVGPLRIVVSSLDLDDPSKYCATSSGTAPDFKGGTVACSTDFILTSEKKTALLTHIIPGALQRLSAALSVNQLSTNLVVGSGVCSPFTISTAHTSGGVANADFVLYVAAGPTTGTTAAWAGACQIDQNGRPVVGRANFNPKYISWDPASPAQQDGMMDLAGHEILHALGISGGSFLNKSTVDIRGKTGITIVSSPNVLAKAREFLGCPTLAGVELEDEGSYGSVGSHWERRLYRDEVMTASAGTALSAITLAALDDSGHYTVDYSKADTMSFGSNAGCGFVENKCNTVEGGMGKYFCFDSSTDQCLTDYSAFGPCSIYTYTSDLPSYFQYFSDPRKGGATFMDGCPVVTGYSNRQCKEYKAEDTVFGYYYGNGSRCFNTTGLIVSGSTTGSLFRCLQASCSDGRVQFRVGDAGWVLCPADGSEGWVPAPAGWTQSVFCPKATTFCDANITVGGVPPTIAPTTTTATTTTGAPPSLPTTTSSLPPAPTTAATTSSPSLPTTSPPGATTTTPPTSSLPLATAFGPTTAAPAGPGFTTIATAAPVLVTPTGLDPTTTASPSSPAPTIVALIKGRVKLSGTRFPILLANPTHSENLKLSVRKDIAVVLNISHHHVAVTSMTIGSLLVDYEVDVSSSETVETVKAAMLAEVGLSNFNNTQVVYSAVSGEIVVVEGATAEPAVVKSGSLCGTAFPHTDCLVALIVGLVLISLFIIIAVTLCVRRGQKRDKKRQEYEEAKERWHQKQQQEEEEETTKPDESGVAAARGGTSSTSGGRSRDYATASSEPFYPQPRRNPAAVEPYYDSTSDDDY